MHGAILAMQLHIPQQRCDEHTSPSYRQPSEHHQKSSRT
jgi:hypothetical protein